MSRSLDEAAERLRDVDLRGRVDDGPDILVPLKAGHIRAILSQLSSEQGRPPR